MAAIIQADPYQALSRRIGYSVGLENLTTRVSQLVSLYVAQRGLNYGSFRDLVEKQFGLTKNVHESTAHVGNFYRTLNLIKVLGQQVEPLYQLDTLAILNVLIEDPAAYDVAFRFVLIQCILEADAEVFLNGLISDFEPSNFRLLLEAMSAEKIRQISGVIRSPALFRKISQIVTIKNQTTTTVSEGTAPTVAGNRFGRRTVPLSAHRRTSDLTPAIESESSISDDYVAKAAQTRKRWAEDLGLFRDGAKTELGEALLRELSQSVVMATTNGAAIFWAYRSELVKIRIKPEQLHAPDCEEWDVLAAISRAFVAIGTHTIKKLSPVKVIDFLADVGTRYREARDTRSLIRNSLPLYVAAPVLVGWCTAMQYQVPPLFDILGAEFTKPKRRVQKMIIRGTAGALYFMR